jgi:predicted ATPase
MSKKYGNLDGKVYNYSQRYEIKVTDDSQFVESVIADKFTDDNGREVNIEVYGGHRREFIEYKSTKIFRPDPSKLVQQVKLSADEVRLLPDCSNIISFFYYVDNNFRNSYSKQIKEDFTKCVSEIAYFTLPPVKIGNESLLGLRFFDKEDNGYWADEVSEGVLYFLSLLCIINQPNPPKLLLLEEPEKGIHPRRIREVMDFIFRLAEEKDIQIILTTHNEHVLDDFATRPESVFVFDKDDEGATYVRNLQRDIIEPTNQRNEELGLDPIDLTSNLSENWLYGLLGGVPAIS